MKLDEIVKMFPADEERYSVLPQPAPFDPETGRKAYNGPLVVTPVNNPEGRVIMFQTRFGSDDGENARFEGLCYPETDRPLRVHVSTVGKPGGDGAFVVEVPGGDKAPLSSFDPGLYQIRPLVLDDHLWIGVPREDDILSLARKIDKYGGGL